MTEHATHVLAAAGPLERADLPHFSDCLAPVLAAQYTPAVVPVGADRRPGWWPLAALGERLGVPILPEGIDARVGTRTTTSFACACARLRGPRSTSSRRLRARSSTRIDRSAGSSATYSRTGAGTWRRSRSLAQLEQVAEAAAARPDPPSAVAAGQLVRARPALRARPRAGEHPRPSRRRGGSGGRRRRPGLRRERLRAPRAGSSKVDGSIRRGAVAIPHGLAAPNVSTLLSATENVDLLTGMPTYSGVAVTLSAL